MRRLDFWIESTFDGVAAAHYLRREKQFSYALVVKLRHNPDSLLLDGVPMGKTMSWSTIAMLIWIQCRPS